MTKAELVEAYKAERAGERVKATNELEAELG